MQNVPKLLPFNLEQALAGAQVVTRDGRPVLGITDFSVHTPNLEYPIVGIIGSSTQSFTKNGVFHLAEKQTCFDLFLVEPEPKRVVAYHVMFNDGRLGHGHSNFNSSQPSAYPVYRVTTEKQPDGTWRVAESVPVTEQEVSL